MVSNLRNRGVKPPGILTTNILPLDHVRTQMPFALCAGVLAAAAYLIYGFAFL